MRFSHTRPTPRGQVMVLACAVIIFLVICVLSVVNIGHTVSERIRLQNNADAAAYSMAVLEARAFNFYALTNRTQVSHYVSAMLWHSMLSFIYFNEAFFTDTYGMMKSLSPCERPEGEYWQKTCPMLRRDPAVASVIDSLSALTLLYRETIVRPYQQTLKATNPDRVIGREIIPAHQALNGVLAASSTALMKSVLEQVQGGAEEVLKENDPNLDPHQPQTNLGDINACLFDRAHDRSANGSPLRPNLHPFEAIRPSSVHDDEKESRAKRTLGAIANASRGSCDGDPKCPKRFLTARRGIELLSLPDWLGPVKALVQQIPKRGQTRLLTYRLAKGDEAEEGGNFIRDGADAEDAPMAMMAQGDNLGADDLYSLQVGPPMLGSFRNPFFCSKDEPPDRCWGDPREDLNGYRPYRFMLKTSVWALNPEEQKGTRGGIHWRVAYPGNDPHEGELGLNVVRKGQALVYVANVRAERDGNHPWQGVTPFNHFESGDYSAPCGENDGEQPSTRQAALANSDFNQPSTWSHLNKGPEALRNPISDSNGTNRPALINPQGTLGNPLTERAPFELDAAAQVKSGFPAGLNAVARGQVYYHRPGNWKEHPNFFNPYWHARLAPILDSGRLLPQIQRWVDALPPRMNPKTVLVH